MMFPKENLFHAISHRIDELPLMDEAYYNKHLFYKSFCFAESSFDEVVDLFAKMAYTLKNHKLKYYVLMDKKLIEAQNALCIAYDDLYSERIRYNSELKQLVDTTIIPYYHGRFHISLSREISFLPLELRLYIYTRMLAIEANTAQQLHLVDRIALTLHKLGEQFLGDCAIFISAWMKSKLGRYLGGYYTLPFSEILVKEKNSVQQAGGLRETILSKAEMTQEQEGREFWYGFKSFSSLKSIHDVTAAKICLDLFKEYYKHSFSIVNEIHSVIKTYYETKDSSEINDLIRKEELDSVSITKRYVQHSYHSDITEMSTEKVDLLDWQQRIYAQKFMNHQKESNYLYLNPDSKAVNEIDLKIPATLSKEETVPYLKKLSEMIRKRKLALSEFNQYLLDLTTAIMNGENWDMKDYNLMIGTLGTVYSLVWLRNRTTDKITMLEALIDFLEEKPNVLHIGKGWPVGWVIVENHARHRTFAIFYTMNRNLPEFVGYNIYNGDANSLKKLSIEKQFLESRAARVEWNRIEKDLDAPKSLRKRRATFWKKLRLEREREISGHNS